MSSERFIVQSFRDGVQACANFTEGNLNSYIEEPCNKNEHGTIVSFIPDKKVFINDTEGFSYERICSEIKNISYLNKGLRFIIATTDGKKTEYYSENGISGR